MHCFLFLALLWPQQIDFIEKMVIFSPKRHQWAAYENGKLIKHGKASGGRLRCIENKSKSCRTPRGIYKVTVKYGKKKRSIKYPIDCKKKECAPMPYFVKFRYDGIGFHGAKHVPNYHASHGCIRVSVKDAKWINNFLDIGDKIVVHSYKKHNRRKK